MALMRVATAVLAVVFFHLWGDTLVSNPSSWLSWALVFTGLLTVIMFSSFGVGRAANTLANRLGEPYGSLILTLSVVIIEVVLISAVMVGPTPAPTIGRDSIFAVMMIILNLVVGVSILVGSRRHGRQSFNHRGTDVYLILIATLSAAAFLAPRLFFPYTGGFPAPVALAVSGVVAAGYVTFLFLQMGRWRRWFQPVSLERGRDQPSASELNKRGILFEFAVLLSLLIAITLLADYLALLIDFGIARTGLPIAFGGVLIAAIVFTPESITSIQAAAQNEMQRVINLCLGAFVSTIALSFPAVLTLGVITKKEVIFGLGTSESILLIISLVLMTVTFRQKRTTPLFGFLHLALFGGFVATLFI